jgi:outer membrane protein OmpA-like peptidoglycan-associated protein
MSKNNKQIRFYGMSLIILGLSLFSSLVFAIDLKGYKFTDSFRYSFLDDAGMEKFRGPLVLTTSFSHVKSPLYVTDTRFNNFVREVISRYKILTLGGSYRFNERFSLGIETGLIYAKMAQGNSETHISDSVLKAKLRLLSDKESTLTFVPELTLPSGSQESYTTKKDLSIGGRAVYESMISNLHFLGSVGFLHSPKNKFSIIDYRNQLLTELGLSYDLNDFWNMNLEMNRYFTLASDYRQDEGDYYLTLKNKTNKSFSTYGGLGIAGLSELDRKNWTAFIGLKFNFGSEDVPVVVKHQPIEKAKVVEKIVEKAAEKIPPVPLKITSAKEEKKLLGDVFAFENIYFDNAKANIKSEEQKKIDEFVTKIAANKEKIKHIVIEGYASKVGNPKLNQKLSKSRAENVQKALADRGMVIELTSIVAYGDRAKNQDKDLNKNRKVQFRLYLNKDSK